MEKINRTDLAWEQDNPNAQVDDFKVWRSPSCQRKDLLRAGLLLLGSAAFGGIAVAIWNRRTLAKMQEEAKQPAKYEIFPDDEAIY